MSHTKNYLAKLIKVFEVCLVKGIPHDLNVHVIQVLKREPRVYFHREKVLFKFWKEIQIFISSKY